MINELITRQSIHTRLPRFGTNSPPTSLSTMSAKYKTHRGGDEVHQGHAHDLVDILAEGRPHHAVAHAHHEDHRQGQGALGRPEDDGEHLSASGPGPLEVPVPWSGGGGGGEQGWIPGIFNSHLQQFVKNYREIKIACAGAEKAPNCT